MIESPATFLTTIGTFRDAETGLETAVTNIDETNGTSRARIAILLNGEQVGDAVFEFVDYCSTVLFVSIELTTGQNLGFMTRWLQYGDDVIRAFGVRRATTSPAGYAVNVFTSAGWSPNTEDGLGTMARIYEPE